jgi:hypothetical protein
MLYNSLSYCNLCDDKANDSESKPVEIDKLADDKGEAILSLEYILIQIMAFVCLFVCLFVRAPFRCECYYMPSGAGNSTIWSAECV